MIYLGDLALDLSVGDGSGQKRKPNPRTANKSKHPSPGIIHTANSRHKSTHASAETTHARSRRTFISLTAATWALGSRLFCHHRENSPCVSKPLSWG